MLIETNNKSVCTLRTTLLFRFILHSDPTFPIHGAVWKWFINFFPFIINVIAQEYLPYPNVIVLFHRYWIRSENLKVQVAFCVRFTKWVTQSKRKRENNVYDSWPILSISLLALLCKVWRINTKIYTHAHTYIFMLTCYHAIYAVALNSKTWSCVVLRGLENLFDFHRKLKLKKCLRIEASNKFPLDFLIGKSVALAIAGSLHSPLYWK